MLRRRSTSHVNDRSVANHYVPASFYRLFLLGLSSVLSFASTSAAAEPWESTVSPFTPGSFPELRSLRATYNFGWNGVTAGHADIRFEKNAAGLLALEATGGTTGFARALWTFDVKHVGTSDAQTLRPVEVQELERGRKKEMTTKVSFTSDRVTSVREERRESNTKSKTRTFEFPNVFSVNSALLYLRTQPLQDGAVQRIVVYPATSAYLCTIKVCRRERVTVPTGSYNAIKVDVQLGKIGKKRELLPHKSFRRATVWLSDDPDRLILRIETQVFVGSVYAELQSVQFEPAKP